MSAPSTNSAAQPALRPDYSREQLDVWLRRHEALAERARQGGIDLAFFGDSLTDGWHNQGRASWDATFEPRRAANFGLPGDRTQQVLWRMQHGELEGYTPEAVVLLIGTNNLDPGLGDPSPLPHNTPEEIVDGVRAIVDCVHQRLPEARVLLHGLLPRGASDAPVRHAIRRVNAGLRLLDNGGRTVRFVDAGATLLEADGSLGPGFAEDRLHLNAEGYRRWAQALLPPLCALAPRALRGCAPPSARRTAGAG